MCFKVERNQTTKMDTTTQRKLMVERRIRARGVRDPRVLAAMGAVPREAFLSPEFSGLAYDDCALPIEAGQTISQPYIVALMTEALDLRGGETVLEIGTGSGYGAAVLAHVAKRVFTVERIPELADLARERLARLGYPTVAVHCGDGSGGWPEHAPYDAIIATAGAPDLPRVLLEQLAIGGRIVMPIGPFHAQELVRVTRTGEDDFRRDELGPVQFVPLIGVHGWPEDGAPPDLRGV
jgi:protein-L-isoaspartate(D-aspartate) O-methyltransferase